MKTFALLVSLLFSLNIFAMDIQILQTTKSGKTILINKGQAEGLAIDQTAHFAVNGKVVGAATLTKFEGTKSVWKLVDWKYSETAGKNFKLVTKTAQASAPVQAPSRAIASIEEEDSLMPKVAMRKKAVGLPYEKEWTTQLNEKQDNKYERSW